MLPWWGWTLLWVVLVVGGAVLVGLRTRAAWRSLRALTAELGRAADMAAALENQAWRLRGEDHAVTAAVQDPYRLREEYRARRAEQRAARSERRSSRMPPWARVE